MITDLSTSNGWTPFQQWFWLIPQGVKHKCRHLYTRIINRLFHCMDSDLIQN